MDGTVGRMTRPHALWRVLGACVLAGALGACGQAPAPGAETSGAPTSGASTLAAAATSAASIAGPARVPAAASAPAPATAATPAAAASVPPDQASTPRYRIAIEYPELPSAASVLVQALHANALAAKRGFMQALPDPVRLPEFANRQLELRIDYRVAATTPAFTSVRARGAQDTGGAHPIPLEATFVFDRRARRLVALDDLFADPAAARDRLAEFARGELRRTLLAKAPGADEASAQAREEWLASMNRMIDDGTKPTAEDFAHFVARADGIELLFPPYQVAPYVYGTQLVSVPSRVFAALLKPEYRAAFGVAP